MENELSKLLREAVAALDKAKVLADKLGKEARGIRCLPAARFYETIASTLTYYYSGGGSTARSITIPDLIMWAENAPHIAQRVQESYPINDKERLLASGYKLEHQEGVGYWFDGKDGFNATGGYEDTEEKAISQTMKRIRLIKDIPGPLTHWYLPLVDTEPKQ